MRAAPYESESLLQRLLADYPNLLAGGRSAQDSPTRWMLISQEVGVPKEEGGSGHWSLDHLFVDQDAVPTIVEVKRSSDTRIRREVVGQMLDYAANGVRYWPVPELRARLELRLSGPAAAAAAVAELVGGEMDDDAFWQRVGDNLRAGRIRMVFVADVIPAELQRIVEFLNEQMTHADVIALEVKQYVGQGRRTLVPSVIGRTATAQQAKGVLPSPPYEELVARSTPDAQELEQLLLDWATRSGLRTRVTAKARQVHTADELFLFQYYPTWSSLEINIERLRHQGKDTAADRIKAMLDQIAEGRKLSDKYVQVPAAGLARHWERFTTEVVTAYEAALRAPTADVAE